MLVSQNQLFNSVMKISSVHRRRSKCFFGSPKHVYVVTMGQTYQYDLVPKGHVNQ